MANLKLTVPEIVSGIEISVGSSAQEIDRWIASLPLADPDEAADAILSALAEANRAALGHDLRHRMATMLQPIVDNIARDITHKFLSSYGTLQEKTERRAIIVQQLYKEMAYGWKHVLSRIFAVPDNRRPDNKTLAESIHHIIRNHSAQILLHYLVYDNVPRNVWREVHGLYFFAQSRGLHDIPVAVGAKATIEQAYLAIVLLAALNPFRLMRGEALKVYEMMSDKTHLCKLHIPPANWRPYGELCVNLANDMPPLYVLEGAGAINPAVTRIVNIEGLQGYLQGALSELEKRRQEGVRLTLAERAQRDFLSRLVQSWKGHLNRSSKRQVCSLTVEVVAGLTACCWTLGLGSENAGSPARGNDGVTGLALAPDEPTFWPASTETTSPVRPGGKPEVARFKIDDSDVEVWSMDLSERKRPLIDHHSWQFDIDKPVPFDFGPERTEPEEPVTETSYTLLNINQSEGGLALCFEGDAAKILRVGELICVRPSGNNDVTAWRMGVVRWLQLSRKMSGVLGVMNLADQVVPVMVMAVEGAGQGSSYNQALLVQASAPADHDGRVIVPASIYDEGTMLLVQNQGMSIRLQSLEQASDSFACFSYKKV